MMLAGAVITLLVVTLLHLGWYLYFLRKDHLRASTIRRWIEGALAGRGQVQSPHWEAGNRFVLPLRLASRVFRNARIVVEFAPRKMVASWILGRVRGSSETFTFQADFDHPPRFATEVHRQRWFGRTAKRLNVTPAHWLVETPLPVVFSTRRHWQQEVVTAINGMRSPTSREYEKLTFRRNAPHFTATFLLDSLREGQTGSDFFESLTELAQEASPYRL